MVPQYIQIKQIINFLHFISQLKMPTPPSQLIKNRWIRACKYYTHINHAPWICIAASRKINAQKHEFVDFIF